MIIFSGTFPPLTNPALFETKGSTRLLQSEENLLNPVQNFAHIFSRFLISRSSLVFPFWTFMEQTCSHFPLGMKMKLLLAVSIKTKCPEFSTIFDLTLGLERKLKIEFLSAGL